MSITKTKTIILAGGLGTRLSELTETVPKPMVKIGGKPMLWHIMKIYAYYGFKNFYIALGHKSEAIKEYFINYRTLNSNFTVDLENGHIDIHQLDDVNWNVTLVDTGELTMTGGRVKRMQPFAGDQTVMLTYGDGVANVDLQALLAFHRSHGKLMTVTAVHPGSRYGELQLDHERVISFQEKPQLNQGWISGGFFVIEPGFFDLLTGDSTVLERQPMEQAVRMGEVMAFQHEGFWHSMDTKRDRDNLERIWQKGNPPWLS